MTDTIPVPVDLLRLAYGASDELDVWLDEHLPPADLGPVTPDTPWGSLCRNGERELLFIGRSATASTEWVAQEPSSWYTYSCPFSDRWRVIRSGPEPEAAHDIPAPEAGEPFPARTLDIGDEIVGTPCRVVIDRVTGLGTHAVGECSTCGDRHSIHRDLYLAGRGPWHPAVTVEIAEPEDGPLGTHPGDPVTLDTPIGTWVKMADRDYMTQVSDHGSGWGDHSLRWWTAEGRWVQYNHPTYTVADPAEVEQWQAQQ